MNKIILVIINLFFIIASPSYSQTANWSPVAPDFFPTNVSGQIHGISRISQLKFHPTNSQKFYAISARGGLFISINAGNTWTIAPGCDLMPGMRLASVCIDHTNDQILYLGTGDHNYYYSGSGVYKSTNGGATFTLLNGGLPTNKLVVEIIMHPTDPATLVAATNGGIYKTINAGVTWTLQSASNLQFADMKSAASANSLILFASTTETSSELYRSTDFGSTWAAITSGIPTPPQ